MKYRKRPVVVEAVQWTGRNYAEVVAFVGRSLQHDETDAWGAYVEIPTSKRLHTTAWEGDWIVRNETGELGVLDADIFEAAYELVEEES